MLISFEMTSIPYDVYESDAEIVVVVPLWGVSQDSLNIFLDKNILLVTVPKYKLPEQMKLEVKMVS